MSVRYERVKCLLHPELGVDVVVVPDDSYDWEKVYNQLVDLFNKCGNCDHTYCTLYLNMFIHGNTVQNRGKLR